MNTHFRPSPADLSRSLLWLGIAWLGLGSSPIQAEDADPAGRVARVSYLKGEVYTQTADADDWADARINQPLTGGDQLWTDRRGRAELQLGGTTLQIDADTQLQLLELSDDVAQIQLTQGIVNVYVRNLSKRDTVEIDTPNAAASIMESGSYRIEVADDDELTVVQVRAGSVDVAGEQQNYTVRDNEQLRLRGRRGSAEFANVDRMDEFDRWAADRNQRAERVVSSRYVGAGVIGYEDLDDYGYWRWYNDYGYVWMPTRVVSGWAPYRYGHWTWVSPWGWTWIDDAPWGFAPFHYGRWTTIGSRWCWVPGPRTVRAVYAPALVTWIGTPGLSISVNVGTRPVGWIPLGPREIYRPYYRTSHNYLVNINISNSLLRRDEFERGYRRQPHEVNYINRRAASVVQGDALRNARPVHDQLLRSPDRDLQPLTDTPMARPDRREQVGRQRTTPPVTPNVREVLARRQPSAAINHDGSTFRSRNVRIIEPSVVRPSSGAGAGPDASSNRWTQREAARPEITNRAPELNQRNVPGSGPAWSPRGTVEPPIRTDGRSEQREQWRGRNAPNAPAASPREIAPPVQQPESAPRVRSYSRSEEMRASDRRERNLDPGVGAMPQQPQRMPMPEMPRTQRGGQATAPGNAGGEQPREQRGSQNDNGRERGFRGETR